MTKPTDRQIEAVEDVLRGLVIITGDSTWDMNYVAKAVLAIERCAKVAESEPFSGDAGRSLKDKSK